MECLNEKDDVKIENETCKLELLINYHNKIISMKPLLIDLLIVIIKEKESLII